MESAATCQVTARCGPAWLDNRHSNGQVPVCRGRPPERRPLHRPRGDPPLRPSSHARHRPN